MVTPRFVIPPLPDDCYVDNAPPQRRHPGAILEGACPQCLRPLGEQREGWALCAPCGLWWVGWMDDDGPSSWAAQVGFVDAVGLPRIYIDRAP